MRFSWKSPDSEPDFYIERPNGEHFSGWFVEKPINETEDGLYFLYHFKNYVFGEKGCGMMKIVNNEIYFKFEKNRPWRIRNSDSSDFGNKVIIDAIDKAVSKKLEESFLE